MASEPKWLALARAEVGTKEIPGARSNPNVGQYYASAVGSSYPDSVPWCAAFVGAMLKRAGVTPSGSLLARSYLHWGHKLAIPIPGAIAIYGRGKKPSGHVGFVAEVRGDSVKLLGGNQKDAVSYEWRKTANALGFRWPKED